MGKRTVLSQDNFVQHSILCYRTHNSGKKKLKNETLTDIRMYAKYVIFILFPSVINNFFPL